MKKIFKINTSISVIIVGILFFSSIAWAAIFYGIVADSSASLVGHWPLDEGSEKGLTGFYDLSVASHDSVFSTTSQDQETHGLAFNTDGTKMFIVGMTNDRVYEYHLTTGFDVSSASYDSYYQIPGVSFLVNPVGLAFNTDGTKMFIVDIYYNNVSEYHLTTGFDVSTTSFDSDFDVSGEDGNPTGVTFNINGTKMFVTGVENDNVYEYHLTTGFDVSTASHDSSFDISGQDDYPEELVFSADGFQMFVVGSGDFEVNVYDLGAAFDVSSASYSSVFSVSGEDTDPRGIAFNLDGSKMLLVGETDDDVNEYHFTLSMVVADKTANENHGEIYETAYTTDHMGQANKAMIFDGVDDNIIISDIDFSDEMTGSVWVKFDEVSSQQMVVSQSTVLEYQLQMRGSAGSEYFRIRVDTNGGNGIADSTTRAIADQWYNITWTYDGSDLKIYVDGVLESTNSDASGNIDDINENVGIGARSNGDYPTDGSISDVRIYDKALSAKEVTSIYEQYRPKTQFSTRQKGLVGHWMLDSESEKVGDNINDNGDFETGDLTGWSYWFNSANGAAGSGSIDSSEYFGGSYSGKINITNGGGAIGDINFSNKYFTTATSTVYRLSFAVKADFTPTAPFSARIIKNTGPYTNCGLIEDITPTSEWQTYDYTFDATYGFTDDVRVIFYLGNIGIGNIYFDNVSFKEVSIADKTPNENHGDVYGAVSTTDQMGQADRAMVFDGTNDYVEITDSTDFDIDSNGFTYTAWINGTDFTPAYNMFMGHYLPYFNVRSTGKLHLSVHDGTQRSCYGNTVLDTDTWYFVSATYDSDGYMRVFVNGEQDGIAGPYSDLVNSSSHQYIGQWYNTGTYKFTGSISDVRVYNYALDSSELETLYHSYRPKISSGSLQKGLVGHWPLDGESEKVDDDLLANGDCEIAKPTLNSASSGARATTALSSTEAFSGVSSTKLTLTEDTTAGFYNIGAYNLNNLTPGKTYRYSGYVYIPSSGGVSTSAFLQFYDYNGAYSAQTQTITTEDEWVPFSITRTIRSDATMAFVRVSGSGLNTEYLYFDNLSLREVETSDKGAYSNHGEVYGPTSTTGINGETDGAMSFDGTDDYINMGNEASFQVTGSQTISMWLYPDNFSARRNPLAKAYGGEGTITQETDGDLSYYYGTAGSNTTPYQGFRTTSPLTLNNWNHIVLTRDLDNMVLKWYLNGAEITSTTALYSYATASSLDLKIGDGYTSNYAGKIANVRIYNRALSDEEIALLYSRK